MKVYLVTEDTSYEGWRIVSVWSTRKAAESEIERLKGADQWRYYVWQLDIEEHEVRD